jgi:SAM-dependent methyltransferase
MKIPYTKQPTEIIKKAKEIYSFQIRKNGNIDLKTVDSFGEEWKTFKQFSEGELEKIGADYFDILPASLKSRQTVALDVGCGSGRWAAYIAPFVGHIDCIDPSIAVFTAAEMLKAYEHIRITRTDVDNLPFPDESYDLVYSLGVLHHIPDTGAAMKKCVEKVKRGGYFLVYLYYNLDNRGIGYKLIFQASTLLRLVVSKLPGRVKKGLCDALALAVYYPLAKTSHVVKKLGLVRTAEKLPLAYYGDKSFWIMRNDALDRFGTPLEQRFTKAQIEEMMQNAGLSEITFSNRAPYWHAIGKKL